MVIEVVVDLGELFGVVEEPVVLMLDGVGVDLVEHRVEHRLDCAPGVLGAHRHQVRGVVGPAALP